MIYKKEVTATRIKERRKALHLTQSEVAEKIGIDTATLGSIERQKSTPRHETLLLLCEPLQCEIGFLYGEFNTPHRITSDIQSVLELSEATIEKLCNNYDDRISFFDYFVKNADHITDKVYNLQILDKAKSMLYKDEYRDDILQAFKESGANDLRRKAGLYYSHQNAKTAEYLFRKKLLEILQNKGCDEAANISEWKVAQYFETLFFDGYDALRFNLQLDFMQLVNGYIEEIKL